MTTTTYKRAKITENKKISRLELVEMFMNPKTHIAFTGVAFAHISYQVQESGSRTVQGEKMLQKFTRQLVTLGSSYEARVNRDLEKREEDGNFTAQGITGRTHVNSMLVVADKTQEMQLRCIVEHRNLKSGIVIYFHKGQRISKSKAIELNMFAPSYFAPKTTSGRGNMSEETDFNFFTLGIKNIHSITMNKTRYTIED